MELVDHKQKVLVPPEITLGALENMGVRNEVSMLALGSYLGHPKTKTVQINNTLFAYNQGKKDGRKEAVSHMYNMDAQSNLHVNLIKYLAVLQKRGVHGVLFTSTDKNFLGAFLKILPVLTKYGSKGGIAEKPSKKTYVGRVTFGETLLGKKQK